MVHGYKQLNPTSLSQTSVWGPHQKKNSVSGRQGGRRVGRSVQKLFLDLKFWSWPSKLFIINQTLNNSVAHPFQIILLSCVSVAPIKVSCLTMDWWCEKSLIVGVAGRSYWESWTYMYELVVCEHIPKTVTARNKSTGWKKGGMLGKNNFFFSRKWVGREILDRKENIFLVWPNEFFFALNQGTS